LADGTRDPDEGVEILFRERGDVLSRADGIAIAESPLLCRSEAMLERELAKAMPERTFHFISRGKYLKRYGADCAAALRTHLAPSDKQVPRDLF
jgi:hypothetical protein